VRVAQQQKRQRTDSLVVRGSANWPKDRACPLEGIVETDWSPATFTMNWKLTRPHWPVDFGENEAICMLVPHRRGELEGFRPEVRNLYPGGGWHGCTSVGPRAATSSCGSFANRAPKRNSKAGSVTTCAVFFRMVSGPTIIRCI
jgi:hypothetical protein